jgi:hypothetical protein
MLFRWVIEADLVALYQELQRIGLNELMPAPSWTSLHARYRYANRNCFVASSAAELVRLAASHSTWIKV